MGGTLCAVKRYLLLAVIVAGCGSTAAVRDVVTCADHTTIVLTLSRTPALSDLRENTRLYEECVSVRVEDVGH